MKKLITGILILVLVLLVGCSEVEIEAEPDPVTEQPAEIEPTIVEEVIPLTKGLAEELALEASAVGLGWERIRMDVKADGNWIDQTLHRRYIKDELEFTEQVTQIIRVYPDIESALLDSELCKAKYQVWVWEHELEECPAGGTCEYYQARIEQATPDLPFWDEAYRHSRVFLRKDNVIVIFEFFRGIRRYDPLLECFTPVLSFQLTLEQEQWLDEENYVDELLYSLASKAEIP